MSSKLQKSGLPLAVITGAGSGIGRETAFLLAQRNHHVLALDLDADAAERTAEVIRLAGMQATARAVDVADAAGMQEVADWVSSEFGAAQVVINNAGVGCAGRFLDATLPTWKRTIDVNLMGVVHGCRAFLPAMVARRRGHVVNVASGLGLIADKNMPVYAASKFAVVGLSEALRADLSSSGIGVSVICPGIINTPIVSNTRFEGPIGAAATREKVQQFYRRRNFGPEKVALAIARAIERNSHVVPVAPEIWFGYLFKRIAPRLLDRIQRIDLIPH